MRLLRSSSLATSATSSSGATRGWPSSDVTGDVVFGWWLGLNRARRSRVPRGGPSDDQDASLRIGWYSGSRSPPREGARFVPLDELRRGRRSGRRLPARPRLLLLRRSSAASSSSLRLRAARACSRCCCASSFERSTADDLCMSSASDTTRRRSALSVPTRGTSSAPWSPPSRRFGWRRCS